jgi:hypothetical protein
MKHYVIAYLTFLVLLILLAGVTNIVVDPYGVFGLIDAPGFNRVKPYTANNEQIHKPVTLYRSAPEVVLLGSSTAQFGLDPREVRRITGRSAYNAGIDGPSIFEVYHWFEFAARNTASKRMVVVLDLMMFNGSRGLYDSRFNITRMRTDLSSDMLGYLNLREAVKVFVSFRTFTESVRTVLRQSGQSYYDLGFLRNQNVLREQPYNYDLGFVDSREAYLGFFSEPTSDGDWFITADGEDLFESFRRLVTGAYSHDIDLSIVLAPVHAYFMEGLREKGLDPVFRQWRRRVNDVLREEAQEVDRPPLALFDYTDDNEPRNHEAVPDPYTKHMTYWNDAYHFSIFYGNEMIRDIFQEQRSQ